jgi:hypothetical protein
MVTLLTDLEVDIERMYINDKSEKVTAYGIA